MIFIFTVEHSDCRIVAINDIIDDQRNELETQAEALTSVMWPDIYALLWNPVTSDIFKDFVFTHLKKGNANATVSTFKTFPGGKQDRKSPTNARVKLFN